MKTFYSLFVFVCLFWIISFPGNAAMIKIDNKSCEYSIQVPNGWETIPEDTLKARFGKNVIDAGLYKKGSNTYFEGEYIQYVFLPTAKSLNQFSFKKLTKNFKRGISQSVPQDKDSIRLITENTSVSEEQKCFYIKGTIKSNSIKRSFTQCILPTKFGFLKIIHYRAINKEESELTIEDIYSNTEISDSYFYNGPPSKSSLSVWHIVLAFGIGLVVYIIIQYGPVLVKKIK